MPPSPHDWPTAPSRAAARWTKLYRGSFPRPPPWSRQSRDALALSAYELLFAHTPPHVAVSEGVELVRSVQPRAAGFANAVLRRLADATPDFPWGDPATDDEALARSVGHPLWLARMWVEELGRDVASGVMHANNEPAPLFLAHLPFAASFEETLASLTRDGVDPATTALPGCIVAGVPSAAVRCHALRRASRCGRGRGSAVGGTGCASPGRGPHRRDRLRQGVEDLHHGRSGADGGPRHADHRDRQPRLQAHGAR